MSHRYEQWNEQIDAELKKAASVAINRVIGLHDGERVLIITNPHTDGQLISQALYDAAENAGGKGILLTQGVKSQQVSFGNGWQAEGCYRNRGTSYVHFLDNAADCRKLKVDGKNMANPAIYMSVQGADLERAYAWSTKNMPADSNLVSSLTQPIPSKLAISPSCGG